MKIRLIYTASLTALAAGLLFACGNGDDDDTSTATDAGTADASVKLDASTTTKLDAATTADAAPVGDAATATDSGADAADSAVAPTFTNVYEVVLSGVCASCHGTPTGDGATSGNLLMDTKPNAYSALVSHVADGASCGSSGLTRVVPDSSSTSLLWQKVNGNETCGSQMPLGGAKLPQSQIDLIAAWINAGALND